MSEVIIAKKISDFLQRHSTLKEECEVIYLMVEIRKIMDYNRDNPYNIVRFYCNWALHVNLKYKKTTQFISNIFDKYIDPIKSGKDIARDMKSNESNFFKFINFKNELKKLFERYNLPLDLINNRKNWTM